jgi:hypothetical protein
MYNERIDITNYKLLENGKLDDTNLKSEYERGWVDCWNEFREAYRELYEK